MWMRERRHCPRGCYIPAIRKLGRVDHQDAFLDTNTLERNRGITIFSKQAECTLGEFGMTFLDTPGHVDFSAEMERTLQVLDYAILVISGADGVQGHTETLWRLLSRYQIPVFLFINKMDQPGTDREALLAEVKEKLDANCVEFSADQTDEEWKEQVAVCDEQVMEAYLEGEEISREQIRQKTLSLLFWFGTENDRCGGISGRSETPDPGDFLSGNVWSKNL